MQPRPMAETSRPWRPSLRLLKVMASPPARGPGPSGEILHLEQFADLDGGGAGHRVGAALDPVDRLVEVFYLPDPVARGEFADISERTFGHHAVLTRKCDPSALARRLEAAAVEHDSGLDQRLVEGAHFGDEFFARHLAGLGILGGFDDDHDAHYPFLRCSPAPLPRRTRSVDPGLQSHASYSSFGYQSAPRPSGVRSSTIHNGAGSGAPRGSWPGSAVEPVISPDQKWRILSSRRVKTLRAGMSEPSGPTPK